MADKKNRDMVIVLPDTDELYAAKMTPEDIERTVTSMIGDDAASKAARGAGTSVPGISVRSSARIAEAAGLRAPGEPAAWLLTIWRRFCFKAAT